MSEAAVNSTTSTLRQRGTAKQATTCREDWDLLQSYQSGGPLGQSMCTSREKLAKLNYMKIKQLLDRKVIINKRGTLTNREINLLVHVVHDCQWEGELQHGQLGLSLAFPPFDVRG
jgi:hypothetical protein